MASPRATPDLWDRSIPNQSPALIAISILFHLISTVFFTARIIWRLRNRQKGWDDFTATGAWVTLFIQTTFGALAAHYGFGKHRNDIVSTFSKAMFYFYLYQICYMVLSIFTKLTFCFLYLRLFGTHNTFKRILWWTAGIITVGGWAFLLATVWQCTPEKRAWKPLVNGTCIDKMAFWYSHAALNTLMDIVVFVLPIPLIGTLKMARKSKLGLITLFSLGALTVAASIVRMVFLKQFAQSDGDYTWDSMPALIWTEIESNTAMICCCLPPLGSLGNKAWRWVRGQPLGTPSVTEGTPRDNYPGYNHRRRSFGRGPEFPGQDPGLGNFVDIHYSPPRSPVSDLEEPKKKHGVDFAGGSKWLKDLLSSISGINSSSSKSNVPSADIQTQQGYLAPKLEMGTLYKTWRGGRASSALPRDVPLPVWGQPAYMNDSQERRASGGAGFTKLTARDAKAKHTDMGGLSNFLQQPQGSGEIPAAKLRPRDAKATHANMGGLSDFLRNDGTSSDRYSAKSSQTPGQSSSGSRLSEDCPYSQTSHGMGESGDPYYIGTGKPRGKEPVW